MARSEPAAESGPGAGTGTDAPADQDAPADLDAPADAPSPSEPASPAPWDPNEAPTPAYLGTRLVRAARDPRQPESDSVEDAVPQDLPDTHDFRRDRAPAGAGTADASDKPTAAQPAAATSAATAPPSAEPLHAPADLQGPAATHTESGEAPAHAGPNLPSTRIEPHDSSAYAEPDDSSAYAEPAALHTHAEPPVPHAHAQPPAPYTHAEPPNASTEVPSELRSEVRSETPSANSAPPVAGSAPPRRSGVSLVRPHPVTEESPAQGNGSDSSTGLHQGSQHSARAPEPRRSRQSPHPTSEQATRPALGPHPLRTPQGELPGPAAPATPRRSRRRAGIVAAVGVAAAGAVVAVVLLPHSGSPGDDRAGSSTSPSTSATTPGGSSSPTVEGTSRPQSLPPGTHREAGGFAWATPAGWRRDLQTGSEVHYTSPDATQELVGKSSIARGDLMETWQKSEENAHQGQDYQKIRLEKTTFRGNPAVVWEYTFTLKGVPWHARLLGFDQEGKSYQINTWYQPEDEAQALKTYGKVKDSFTVL
ncbi:MULTISPECIES: hypothetical protein [unclassified Streptomyces]|uniref:hypothetical protein n=1 Tax=unclassified Streptomyces TaxID=2593676 RepID=UPI002257D111|nr:hypothetical protein [Streptomyces sp. NBC_00183]MCX5288177.1 hypothetical protein [Streptomyces sp. NBC_00183]